MYTLPPALLLLILPYTSPTMATSPLPDTVTSVIFPVSAPLTMRSWITTSPWPLLVILPLTVVPSPITFQFPDVEIASP